MICTKCQRTLTDADFYRLPIDKRCSECARAATRAWRKENLEAVREYGRAYRAAHPERALAWSRDQYTRDREKILLRCKEYRSRTAAAKRARDTAYREQNREKLRQRGRDWKTRDPLAYRDWVKRNRARRYGARRRDKLDLLVVVARQNGVCAYCAQPLTEAWHLDHRKPLSRGGAHTMENVCAACPRCNCGKKALTAEEFMEKRLLTERMG